MEREAVREGPPGCWGRHRGDAGCAECPWQKSCYASTEEFIQRRTVAEALVDARSERAPVEQVEPDDLAMRAYQGYRKKGGRKLPVNWAMTPKFIETMEQVIIACHRAGWSPTRYIDAQVDALTPIIERGWRVHPGHFLGEKAAARFERWLVRFTARRGNAQTSQGVQAVRRADAKRAAAMVYATARLANGIDRDIAIETAQGYSADWTPSDASHADILEAVNAALISVDPLLPHTVLVPMRAWTWKDARDLFDKIRPEEVKGSAKVLSPSLGDFL